MIKLIKEFLEYKKKVKLDKDPEPYVEIKSEKIDGDGNLQLVLDWNNSFVKLLREKGFAGITDEDVINSYLYQIFWVKQQEDFLKDKAEQSEELEEE